MTAELAPHVVTARDFLMGSIWEGTGDELHTNRLMARKSMFRQRILSGVSGMLLAIDAYRPELIWAPLTRLRWSFDRPLFEGTRLEVRGHSAGEEHTLSGTADGQIVTHGSVVTGPPADLPRKPGRPSAGRTMTEADARLFRTWLPGDPTRDQDLPGHIPWPLIVLTASGLITRGRHMGSFRTVLNRAFTWTFGAPLALEETVHCELGTVERRPSATLLPARKTCSSR
ncbi:hypothetical protein SMD20_39955 [Nonomuraea sp. LP-02]|uniref:hypothetical protein n=1 Tax=Nonomuraea sp. LP-02 TaxID=3097960 RepID=UPI002E33A191|nr:hypothetical protein [Nonomuraea sp. LP-02]MED7930455.1 hypothetical protein [Nonomuraea sp. LP-02]